MNTHRSYFLTRSSLAIIFVFLVSGVMAQVSAQVSAQVCTSAPIGLVSAFGAETNALDARSRNNGTIQNGVTYTAGEVGQALNFAGNNGDRVLVGNPANLQLQDFTIEAWIKRSSSGVVTNSPNAGSPGGIFFAYGQGGYAFLIDQNTNRLGLSVVGVSVVFSSSTITDTNWHHVAVTQSGPAFTGGTGAIFYVDGVANVRTGFQSPFTFTTNGAIGSRGDGQTDNVFFGAIDELAIYNRELSASEIQSIYNSGTVGKCKPLATNVPDNQVLWLAGDGNASDISGNGNNGPLGSTTVFTVGKVGQALQFDGLASSQILIPDSQSLRPTTAVTVEAWVNPSSAASGFQGVLFKGNTGSAGGQPYSFFVNGSGGNRTIVVRVGNNASFDAPSSVGSIPVDVYSHVAFTYDGATIRIYINGVLDSSVASSIGPLAQTDTNPLRIGGLGTSFAYTGGVDEIGVYNRALSAAEIQSISNAGIAGKYKIQSTVPANITAWYPGDGNTNDLQGANTATLLNGTTYSVGKVSQGFQFDGVDDQISIPHNANQNGGSNLTIEAWINPTSLPHGGTIFQKRTSSNGYLLEPTQPSGGGSANGLQFVISIGGTFSFLFTPANVLTTGIWQHVAATYDGAFMRIYVNGVEVGSKTQTGAIDAVTAPVQIGRNAVNNTGFVGGIDEIAIYNRALTGSEIRDIHYAGNGGKYKATINPTVTTKGNAGDVSLSFANLTAGGDIHQVPISLTGLPALPAGSTSTGLAYDISTTASYTGLVTQCFNLPALTAAQFANIGILHLEGGVWVDRATAKNAATRTLCAQTTTFSPFVISQVLAPTAAAVSVSGRTVLANGRGISGVRVMITDAAGNRRTTLSSSFGYYRFDDVASGETYIVTAQSKRFLFAVPTRLVTVDDAIEGLDFVASP